jgi:hypothetical protein
MRFQNLYDIPNLHVIEPKGLGLGFAIYAENNTYKPARIQMSPKRKMKPDLTSGSLPFRTKKLFAYTTFMSDRILAGDRPKTTRIIPGMT